MTIPVILLIVEMLPLTVWSLYTTSFGPTAICPYEIELLAVGAPDEIIVYTPDDRLYVAKSLLTADPPLEYTVHAMYINPLLSTSMSP